MKKYLCMLICLLLSACSAGDAPPAENNSGWSQLAEMPTARSEMPAVVLNGLIYVPGGYLNGQKLEVYDPASNTWETRQPLPELRHHLMAAGYEGKLYVFGGSGDPLAQTPTTTAWVYDPAQDAWRTVAPMPEAHVSGAAVTLEDTIYIVGGVGPSRALLQYTPAADSWEILAKLIEPREHNAAAVLDGKIYAIGGRWRGAGELNTVEIFDPVLGDCQPAPPMNQARAGFGAAVLGGKIYALGGEVFTGGTRALDSVEVYDPRTGGWSASPPIPVPLHGVPVVALNDALFVIGGSDKAGSIDNAGRIFRFIP